jgi:epoxyqueuosine reductase
MNKLLNLENKYLQSQQIVDWGYTELSTPITYDYYDQWVKKDLHGGLNYLSDERKDIRKDLKNLFPQFKSALVFLFDYTAERKRLEKEDAPFQLASYVTGFDGVDYHYWIKDKLEDIASKLNLHDFKLSIDAQPVLERDLAYKAGLGWFGKNSMLISKQHGSYFLIGSILLNKKLEVNIQSNLEPDHCGHCTKCIDECPTNAIIDNKVIDAKKCISTFTIEEFKPAPVPKGFEKVEKLIFGCDICQDVCPWNTKPLKNAQDKESNIQWMSFFNDKLENLISKLETMSNREYKRQFKTTPLERTGRVGMLKKFKSKT